jgi:hypothetical protein
MPPDREKMSTDQPKRASTAFNLTLIGLLVVFVVALIVYVAA